MVGMNVRVGSFGNPPFAAASSRVCRRGHVGRTGWGTHSVVGMNARGRRFVNPPFAAASSRVCRTDIGAAKDGAHKKVAVHVQDRGDFR